METTKRKIDLNALLTGANLLMLGLILLESFRLLEDQNPYVNDRTLLLGVLLCLQTQLALVVERFNRDPFVILLTFALIFYYELRIFTLSYWGFSDVFLRFPYDAEDTNFALTYMLFANLFMYAGLFSVRRKGNLSIEAGTWRATSLTASRAAIALGETKGIAKGPAPVKSRIQNAYARIPSTTSPSTSVRRKSRPA